MKKFRAIASYKNYCDVIINADSLEKAQAIAKELDGGEFTPCWDGDEWKIDVVEEVKS